jgi:hypothetical protein
MVGVALAVRRDATLRNASGSRFFVLRAFATTKRHVAVCSSDFLAGRRTPRSRAAAHHLSSRKRVFPFSNMTLLDNENQAKRRASEGSLPEDQDEQYWKRQCHALQQQIDAFASESEKRELSLKSYIRHLETQVEDLKEQESSDNGKEMERMLETIEEQKREIRMHEILTGTIVSNVTGAGSCDVSVKNEEAKRSTSFRLQVGELIKYEPIGKPDPSLPDFLHNAIEFEPSQAPVLLQNVLQAVFPEEY